MTRLHWIQNSVWAGEMTRIEWEDLKRELEKHAEDARVQAWLFPAPPDVHFFGSQDDQQSIFV